MEHDELLARLDSLDDYYSFDLMPALRAVMELHTGSGINNRCVACANGNKCETIQAIERELE